MITVKALSGFGFEFIRRENEKDETSRPSESKLFDILGIGYSCCLIWIKATPVTCNICSSLNKFRQDAESLRADKEGVAQFLPEKQIISASVGTVP